MGAFWLHNFPAEARARGLNVQTYPGWELRSRSSGGFDGIWGVCLHHTASATNSVPSNDMRYMWENAPTRPVGNFYLARDGTITLGAAGAANTQGAGGPLRVSRGVIPADAGNRYLIAIEAANNGVGEVWPAAQLQAYLRLIATLCEVYKLVPDQDVVLHNTWAPDRKIDPAGPTPSIPQWGGATGLRTWNLAEVRRSVVEYLVPPSVMSELKITNPVRILDTRPEQVVNGHNPHKGALQGSLSLKPHGFTPTGISGVILTITVVGVNPGFVTFWNGVGDPTGSNVGSNGAGDIKYNMAWVPLGPDGWFKVFSFAPNHIIVDQVGWYTE